MRKLVSEINVVPYIDIMLVLLVIFMITTPIMHQSIEVELPVTAQGNDIENASLPLILTIDEQGKYYLNFIDNPESALASNEMVVLVLAQLQLNKEKKQLSRLYVKGAKSASYDTIMQAIGLLKQAGVNSVGLMTQFES